MRAEDYSDPKAVTNMMTPVGSKAARRAVAAVEDDDAGGTETYDRHEVRRLARELVASLDPADIVVADQDDTVVRFSQFVEEAKRAKPASTKPTKRRR